MLFILELMRYIHLNPMLAKQVATLKQLVMAMRLNVPDR
jgi:hypothetical protein